MEKETKQAIITIIIIAGVISLIILGAIVLDRNSKEKFEEYLTNNCDYFITIKHPHDEPLDCYDFKPVKYMEEYIGEGYYCFIDESRMRLYAKCYKNTKTKGR